MRMPLATLLAASLLASAGTFVQAQGGQQQGQPPQQQQGYPQQQQYQAAPAEFSDRDLEKFAQAREGVEKVRANYSEKLGGVQDPDQAQQLQAEATDKMVEHVEDAGLEVTTYNAIAVAMQQDPQLRQRIDGMN